MQVDFGLSYGAFFGMPTGDHQEYSSDNCVITHAFTETWSRIADVDSA